MSPKEQTWQSIFIQGIYMSTEGLGKAGRGEEYTIAYSYFPISYERRDSFQVQFECLGPVTDQSSEYSKSCPLLWSQYMVDHMNTLAFLYGEGTTNTVARNASIFYSASVCITWLGPLVSSCTYLPKARGVRHLAFRKAGWRASFAQVMYLPVDMG